MATSDRYASILNTIIELAKTRGMESPDMDAATLAYELLEAAASEAEVWGVPEQEIGLAGFDPAVLLKISRVRNAYPTGLGSLEPTPLRSNHPGKIAAESAPTVPPLAG